MKTLTLLLVLAGAVAACAAPPMPKNDLPVRDDDAPPSKATGGAKKTGSSDGLPSSDPLGAPPASETPKTDDDNKAAAPCNTAQLPAMLVTSQYDPTFSTPLGAGGLVADGTYTLTEWWKYDGHTEPAAQDRKQSLIISGNGTVAQVVSQTDTAPVGRTSWALRVEDTDVVFTLTCPAPAAGPAPELRFSFRAFDDTLRLYDQVQDEETDFTK